MPDKPGSLTLTGLLVGKDRREKWRMTSLALVLGLSYSASGVLVGQAVATLPEMAPAFLLAGFILLAAVNLLINGQVIFRVVSRFETGVMHLRINILEQVRCLDYAGFEALGAERVWLNLTSGVQSVFEATALLGRLVLNVVGALGCLVMLASISIEAFVLVLAVLLVVSFIFILNNLNFPEIRQEARERESRFFHGINNQITGMKELKLNRQKYSSFFENEIRTTLESVKEARTKEHIMFFNSYIMFVLLLLICAGIILYVLPMWFPELSDVAVRAAILAGILPVSVFRDLPVLMRARAALQELSRLSGDLKKAVQASEAGNSGFASEDVERRSGKTGDKEAGEVRLTLENLQFRYSDSMGEELFRLGPLCLDFAPGEIHFLTGGNGSGKSTLVRLLTGLCPPTGGRILVNKEPCHPDRLRSLVTPVFASPHLFDCLYGQRETDPEKVRAWLERLELTEKVAFEKGRFQHRTLSAGQAKRLALAVAMLEDRPLLVLDEWAAEQDPEHREWYYKTFLPELRLSGKTAIIVTHDSEYFDTADRLHRLENGQVIP